MSRSETLKARWAKLTKEERSAHASRIALARWAKLTKEERTETMRKIGLLTKGGRQKLS